MKLRTALSVVAIAFAAAGCASSDEPTDVKAADPGSGGTVTEHDPGNLLVTSPARAAFIATTVDGTVTVTGSGATSALTIDGMPVQAADDGTFTASISPEVGVNVIKVADGDRSLDVPFLYGDFAPAKKVIARAISLRVNQHGYDYSDDSVISLSMLARHALADTDVFASLEGQTLSGKVAGATWYFDVTSVNYDVGDVQLEAKDDGLYFDASIDNVEIDGNLEVDFLGLSPSGAVALRADTVEVSGNVDLAFDPSKGAVKALNPVANTQVVNFTYDSGNAGFPCCVDSIMTDILRPKVQDAAQQHVQAALPKSLAFSLSQFSLPKSLDLSGAGIPADVDLSLKLDSANFDSRGTTLTTAVGFHHTFAAGDPGAMAPGWLTVSKLPNLMDTKPAFGVSVAIDALNQALFTVWGQRGMERTIDNVPVVGTIHLTPMLPPVMMPNDHGGLRASAGEIVVDTMLGGSPVQAAITIIDDVDVSIDPSTGSLVLTPSTSPELSVTWLKADGVADGLKTIVEQQIQDKAPTLLSPITLPLPTLPLGKIAPSFGSSVGVFGADTLLGIDAPSGRATLYGDFVVSP